MGKFKQIHINVRSKIEAYIRGRIEKNRLSVSSWFAHLEIGNLLVALSTTGLMALGVLPLSFELLIVFAILLFIIGVVGRYLDSVQDDVERLIVYEKHLSEGHRCNDDPDSFSSPSGIKRGKHKTAGSQPERSSNTS